MTGNEQSYFLAVGLLCIGLGLFSKRIRFWRGSKRFAPEWFSRLWRVWMIAVGLVLIVLILSVKH
jgi:uncharacterized membrane protein YiaA